MAQAFYYEEIPLAMIVEAQNRIEERLHDEECRLALNCRGGAAYIELKLKDGDILYVARNRVYNGTEYVYTVQLLNRKFEVLESQDYKKKGDGYIRLDGYCVFPLFMIAVKAIRLGRKAQERA